MILRRRLLPPLLRRLAVACGVAAPVAIVVCGCNATNESREGQARPKVTVVAARQMTVPVIVNPIGTTRALEEVTIRARVKGFLRGKHFKDGGQVEKGQLLLVIEREPYEIQLEQAQAQLQAARATLASAQASKSRSLIWFGSWRRACCGSVNVTGASATETRL